MSCAKLAYVTGQRIQAVYLNPGSILHLLRTHSFAMVRV